MFYVYPIFVLFLISFESHAICRIHKAKELCDQWKPPCRWDSRGCVVGREKDAKEYSILQEFGGSPLVWEGKEIEEDNEPPTD